MGKLKFFVDELFVQDKSNMTLYNTHVKDQSKRKEILLLGLLNCSYTINRFVLLKRIIGKLLFL